MRQTFLREDGSIGFLESCNCSPCGICILLLLASLRRIQGNSKFKDTHSPEARGVVLCHIPFYWNELYFNNVYLVVHLDYCTVLAGGLA